VTRENTLELVLLNQITLAGISTKLAQQHTAQLMQSGDLKKFDFWVCNPNEPKQGFITDAIDLRQIALVFQVHGGQRYDIENEAAKTTPLKLSDKAVLMGRITPDPSFQAVTIINLKEIVRRVDALFAGEGIK